MGSLRHYGIQIAGVVVVGALAYTAVALASRPSLHAVDAEDWCRGFRFGWPSGYCGHDDTCRAPPPVPCPRAPERVRGASLAAGVQAGIDAGLLAAGVVDPPDPRDGAGGDYR